ncbi:hypothetical protein [uncultured Pontibacter sp.]|uniref:hypothetical protein n=1 Tax=uncultured Pontibacter sp. TaxID=453356 RepID=UPI0026371331|nr:hypothetical protein [uncultured Pontibacter sp.]
MKIYNLFYLLLCLHLLVSCDMEEAKPVDSYTNGYINVTINNSQKSFAYQPVKDCYPNAKIDKEGYNRYKLIGDFPQLTLSRLERNLLVEQQSSGDFIHLSFGGIDIENLTLPYHVEYDMNNPQSYAQVQLRTLKNHAYNNYVGLTRYEKKDIEVIITSINKEERRIKGTFSGNVINPETDEVLELKEGSFDVKYNQ